MKKPYQKKYRPNQPEDLHSNGKVNRLAFVSRIVNTENKHLSVKEAWSLTNKRDAKDIGLTQTRFGAALSAAVRSGRLDKTRIQETPTKTVVVFHPINMKPMGLDIPVPLYTRDTTNDNDVFTFDDDDDLSTFDDYEQAEAAVNSKPDAVKVAEQVIAGLPADGPTVSDTPPTLDAFSFNEDEPKEDFVDYMERRKKENDEAEEARLAGLSSTIQHHFTAEQLLDTLNALNPNLHDDVLVAVYEALGKPVYDGLGSLLEPLPRKTEHMSWAFINGNLVVKQ